MTLLLLYTRGFKFMFTKDNFNILLEHHYQDYIIELLLGSEPKLTKIYSLFPVEQKKLYAFLEESLYTRQICSSKLSMITLVFFIKKKNSSLWLVQDYQALSSIMVRNKYLLSLISKLMFQLYRAKYFSKLDIYQGFNNVYIKPGDE